MREGKHDEALLAFATYVHHAPKDMAAYRHIAEIYAHKGVAEHSLISFRRQIKDSITHSEPAGFLFARVAMAIYDIAKDAVVADQFWQFALEKLPEDTCTHNNYADFLLQCERYEEALPYAMTATAVGNTHGDHVLTLGEIYMGMGDREKAKHIYNKLSAEYPEYAPRLKSLLDA